MIRDQSYYTGCDCLIRDDQPLLYCKAVKRHPDNNNGMNWPCRCPDDMLTIENSDGEPECVDIEQDQSYCKTDHTKTCHENSQQFTEYSCSCTHKITELGRNTKWQCPSESRFNTLPMRICVCPKGYIEIDINFKDNYSTTLCVDMLQNPEYCEKVEITTTNTTTTEKIEESSLKSVVTGVNGPVGLGVDIVTVSPSLQTAEFVTEFGFEKAQVGKMAENEKDSVTTVNEIVKPYFTPAIDPVRLTEHQVENEETTIYSTTEMDFHPVIH